MGTNYYHYTNECHCCKRSDVQHIGKSSAGWVFSFHGTSDIRSYKDWLVELVGGTIVSEYGEIYSLDDFRKMIAECHRPGNRNHAREYPSGSWIDNDGYSFSSGEFS